MAAKKKKGGAKKKKGNASDNSEGMGISLPEEKIKYLEGQKQSLQFQLAQRSESTASITEAYESMKLSLHETNERLEKEKELTDRLTRDMTRQYKGMQDELLNKINKRDNAIQDLTDTLRREEAEKKRELKEKDGVIEEKNVRIKSLEDEIEKQCLVFAQMLKEAVDQMQERIEVQSACYDEKSLPIQHRLEEFKFRSNGN